MGVVDIRSSGWIRGTLAASALVIDLTGCGPTTEQDGTTTADPATEGTRGEGTSGAAGTSAGDSGTEGNDGSTTGTTDDPLTPECAPASCGDGVVGLDEACDDANADELDGCTADCRRAAATVVATLADTLQNPVVLEDGSILAWRAAPEPALVKFDPGGTALWSTGFAPGQSVRGSALLVGEQIVLVGNLVDGSDWSGATWRFDLAGAALSSLEDPGARTLVDAGLAADGGIVVLANADEGYTVERQASDGAPVWSRAADPDGLLSLQALAVVDDQLAFVAGGVPGPGEAAIVRVTPDAAERSILSPPAYPNAFFYGIAADGYGGAIAVGDSSGYAVVARVNPSGEIAWVSLCSARGVRADLLHVVDDRILLLGLRFRPEPNCGDVCSGAHWAWLQHLGLDGTLLATDAPDALISDERYVYETAAAVGRDASGELTVVSVAMAGGTGVARFPW